MTRASLLKWSSPRTHDPLTLSSVYQWSCNELGSKLNLPHVRWTLCLYSLRQKLIYIKILGTFYRTGDAIPFWRNLDRSWEEWKFFYSNGYVSLLFTTMCMVLNFIQLCWVYIHIVLIVYLFLHMNGIRCNTKLLSYML